MNNKRWKQRFLDYQEALNELRAAINRLTQLNQLEKQGLIKLFECTFELGWKTLQDYLQDLGIEDIVGPRPVFVEALQIKILSHEQNWLELIEDHSSKSHVYKKEIADHLVDDICQRYIKLLNQLENVLKTK